MSCSAKHCALHGSMHVLAGICEQEHRYILSVERREEGGDEEVEGGGGEVEAGGGGEKVTLRNDLV